MKDKKKETIISIWFALLLFLFSGFFLIFMGCKFIQVNPSNLFGIFIGFSLIILGLIFIPISAFFINDFRKANKKTVIKIVIQKDLYELENIITKWFKLNNFILKNENNNLFIGNKTTSHPFNLKINRVIEIKLKTINKNKILFIGTFFISSNKMENIPLSLTNKNFCWLGDYRNESYHLMNNLLNTIRNKNSRV